MVKGKPIPKKKYKGYKKYKKYTGRSLMAYLIDRAKTGKKAKSFKQWLKFPSRYDWDKMDTKDRNMKSYVKKGKGRSRNYSRRYRRRYWY